MQGFHHHHAVVEILAVASEQILEKQPGRIGDRIFEARRPRQPICRGWHEAGAAKHFLHPHRLLCDHPCADYIAELLGPLFHLDLTISNLVAECYRGFDLPSQLLEDSICRLKRHFADDIHTALGR